MVAREGASERKEEAFSGKKSSARLKKRVHSLSVHFFERLFVEKTRGEEEENSTCERFITRRSEREKERRTKKKRRKQRERILTSSGTKNVRPNHAGFVFQRHARVSRRWRWADDDGTFIVYILSLSFFRLKFFIRKSKTEKRT